MRLRTTWMAASAIASILAATEAHGTDGAGTIVARFSAKGFVRPSAKVRVRLRSAIARWDPGSRELSIGLFSFVANEEDVRKVREWRHFSYAAFGKPSPDRKRWESPPYLLVLLKLKGEGERLRLEDVERYGVNAVRWVSTETRAAFLERDELGQVLRRFSMIASDPSTLQLTVDERRDRGTTFKGFRYHAQLGPRLADKKVKDDTDRTPKLGTKKR